jgi:hypothetical protein
VNMKRFLDEPNTSMYMEDNPYGYILNVNHPTIRPYYERYKAWKGLGRYAISDTERQEFERYMLDHFDKKRRNEAA